jgi:hypothetical protein
VLNDVVGYAAYDRWFYPSPTSAAGRFLLISQGIGPKLIINGDVAMRMPMEIGNFIAARGRRAVRVRQARVPRGHRRHARDRRAVREVTGRRVDDIEAAVASPSRTSAAATGDRCSAPPGATSPWHRDRAGDRQPSSWAIYGPRVPRDEEHARPVDAFLGSSRTSTSGSRSTPTRTARSDAADRG